MCSLFFFFNLLGQRAAHKQYVLDIIDGMPIFLFNTPEKHVYGPFRADGNGGMNIDRYVFGRGTQYPA